MMRILYLSVAIVSFSACAPAPSYVDKNTALSAQAADELRLIGSSFGARSRARLVDAHGVRIGEVFAWQGREGVLIQVRSRGLPPGTHGVHVHAVGNCEDLGLFKASTGHVDGTGGPHGFLHPNGTHRGDLPNLYAHGDGHAHADYFTSALSLSDLTDTDGAALIVHSLPDDYQSQPIGDAGLRIACAAFSPNPSETTKRYRPLA